MQRIWLSLVSIILVFVLIAVVVLIDRIETTPPASHLTFLPKEATTVLHIEGKQLLELAAKDIFFHSRDEELITLFFDELEATRGTDDQKNPGIQLNADILFFELPIDTIVYIGALFHIENKTAFDLHIASYLKENQTVYRSGSTGLFLSLPGRKDLPLYEREKLHTLCKSLLNKEDHHPVLSRIQHVKSTSPLTFWKQNPISRKEETFLQLSLNERSVTFKGMVENEKTTRPSFPSLVPKGFHVSMGQIPVFFNDSLQSLLNDTIPDLRSLSINYFGSEIITEPIVTPFPEGEMIVQFTEPFSKDRLLELLLGKEQMKKGSQTFFEVKPIYAKQLDEHSVYIGTTPFSPEKIIQNNLPFSVSGDTKALTKVEGKGLVMQFINIVPAYTASKEFSSRIEVLEITTKWANKGYELQGTLTFKEPYSPINEVLRWLILGQFI